MIKGPKLILKKTDERFAIGCKARKLLVFTLISQLHVSPMVAFIVLLTVTV